MADFDARDLDDPLTTGVDESTDTATGGLVIKKLGPNEVVTSGTGTYTPFLNQNATGQETSSQGFNTDDNDATASNNDAGLDMSASSTQALRLGDIPIVFKDFTDDGIDNPVAYYEIRLDINEENNEGIDSTGEPNRELALTEMQIYTSSRQAVLEDYDPDNYEDRALGDDFNLVFDLDADGDNTILLFDSNPGGGKDDYIFYIPLSTFEGASPDSYFTLFSQFGPSPDEGATPEEWRVQTTSRINGVKFNDLDGDGVKDGNEGGLAGFVMYIDSNNNNIYDVGEVTATSGADGSFTFYGLLAGNYIIREVPNGDWINTTGVGGDHAVTITTGGVNATLVVGNFLPDPEIRIEKEVPSITGGVGGPNGLGGADDAGDVINYDLLVFNEGNLGLTNIVVTDDNADPGSILATTVDGDGTNGQLGQVYNVGDVDFDQILDPGEIWEYTAEHTVTQEDLDSGGNDSADGADNDVDNTASVTGDWSFMGDSGQVSDSDSEDAPLLPNPEIAIDKVVVDVDGDGPDGTADAAGDVITYKVTVKNEGNITLTGVTVVDPLTGLDVAVGTLAPGATWTSDDLFYEVTQADLDGKGGGDGDIDNTATADSNEIEEVDDSEDVPLDYSPLLTIDKVVVDVDGDGPDGTADAAGDVITYKVTVKNEGNITLTGVTVVDPLTGLDVAVGTLAPGATWTSDDLFYEVTQADLDGKGGGDGDIDNTATADSNEIEEVDDSEDVPLDYSPSFTVEKAVSFDGVTFDDADDPDGPQASIMQAPTFLITIANTGNVTLTGFTIEDVNYTFDTVNGTTIDLGGAVLSGDTDNDGDLDVGETWTLLYDQPLDVGYHKNTVTVEFDEAGPISDDAYYYVLVNEGPGVRTPGFWQGPNNGLKFWDGIADNQPHQGDTFPDGDPEVDGNQDLLYAVDSNGDGVIDGADKAGLLIGDYDMDGIRDPGEDVLFISLADAQRVVDASNKKGNDGTYTIGRDAVATWLNYLSGNNIDPTDGTDPNIANAPRVYIDEAIDWLQRYASDENDASVDFAQFQFDAAPKKWQTSTADGGKTGQEIHNALGSYNEDGTIKGEYYAGDSDDAAFAFALSDALASKLYVSPLDQADQDVSQMMYANTLVSV